MKGQPNDRAIILGQYILDNNATVRATAKKFGISKSTVHKDVSERLIKIQPQLYSEVKKILEKNKQESHIRGGMATKKKYEEIAKKVLQWTIRNMQDKKGYFYYQLKPGISSKISYMRWSNAFMFNAMSHYLLAI